MNYKQWTLSTISTAIALVLATLALRAVTTPAISPITQENALKGQIEGKAGIIEAIRERAVTLGVDPDMAVFVARKESMDFNEDVMYGRKRGDMNIICKLKSSPYYGQPVEARGVYQITKCHHFNVPDEITDNPILAIEWAMPLLKTKPTLWSTYKLYSKI